MDDHSNVFLQATATGPGPVPSMSHWATASFAFAALMLVGLLFSRLYMPLVFLFLAFLPAIACGHVARRRFRKPDTQWRNASMATFGLAVGYLGLFLSAFVIVGLLLGGITISGPA